MDLTSPTYLKKAGLCAEQLKDFKKATECYERIRDEYSSFARTNNIEKYVGRAQSQVKGKK